MAEQFVIKKASKKAKKLRIGMSASSGSGKTLGSLLMAGGIVNDQWDKICVIDTERDSASLYSENEAFGIGQFNTIDLRAPYSPDRFIAAIKAAEKDHDVIIIDSITHEWSGEGGCLSMLASLGGRFQDWGIITPKHNAFVDAILTSSSHIFCTVRRKEEFAMVQGAKGMTVEKLGMGEQQRDGFSYEMDIVFEITNNNNMATITKDRTNIFGKEPFMITKQDGVTLREWSSKGRSNLDDAMDALRVASSRLEVYNVNQAYKVFEDVKNHEDYKTLLAMKDKEYPKGS